MPSLLGANGPVNLAAPPDADGQTLGSAVADTASQAWQWLQDQRAQSVSQGMLDPDTGLPTQAGLVDAARQYAQGLMFGTTAPGDVPPGIVAYHGSPHSFDQFDTSKIGTGEGAQAYGQGLYFAENEGVARSYKEGLSPRVGPDHFALMDALEQNAGLGMPEIRGIATAQNPRAAAGEYLDYLNRAAPSNPALATARDALTAYLPNIPEQRLAPAGSMYQVNIGADPAHFLDWDKPFSQQSPHVQDTLGSLGYAPPTASYAVRPVEGGHVVDYLTQDGNWATSRVYQSAADAKRQADITMQMMNRDPTGAELVRRNPGIEYQLSDAGVPGIRYLDQGSRRAGEGSRNYVVFNANMIDILRRYGIAGLIAGGGAAAVQRQQ